MTREFYDWLTLHTVPVFEREGATFWKLAVHHPAEDWPGHVPPVLHGLDESGAVEPAGLAEDATEPLALGPEVGDLPRVEICVPIATGSVPRDAQVVGLLAGARGEAAEELRLPSRFDAAAQAVCYELPSRPADGSIELPTLIVRIAARP